MDDFDKPFNDDGSPKQTDFSGWEKDAIIEYMTDWFHWQYIDPAQETPYVDGEYLYIYGGPYNAEEELYEAFGDHVDDDIIDHVAEEVTSEGLFDWAPSAWHPDQVARAEEYQAELYEDWLKSHHPLDVLLAASKELRDFVEAQGAHDEASFVNRMAFMQAWSILEAYLSAVMLKGINEREGALKAIYEKNSDLSAHNFSGGKLLADPDLLEKTALSYLRRKSYHDLGKIIPIFTAAFQGEGEKKFECSDAIGALINQLSRRHDCVHRNGKNQEDEVVAVSKADILSVLDNGLKLAAAINELVFVKDEVEAQADPAIILDSDF